MHNSLESNKWWNRQTTRTNCFNNCHPFAIAWLRSSRSTSSITSCNYLRHRYNAHLKVGFVKIIDIVFVNIVLRNRCLYALKLDSNKLRIFAFYSLIIVFTIIFRFEYFVTIDKLSYPILVS